MAGFEYRVVPFVGQIRSGDDVAQVSSQLEALINQHASQGWEFQTLNDVNIKVQPGCLAGLLGAKTAYVSYDQIVFRRSR